MDIYHQLKLNANNYHWLFWILQVVLIENDINTRPFSTQVLACLPPLPWSVSSADLANSVREDLRQLRVFSVDPPGIWPVPFFFPPCSSFSSYLFVFLNFCCFVLGKCNSVNIKLRYFANGLCRMQGYRRCTSLYSSSKWKLRSWCPYPQILFNLIADEC